MAKNIKKFGDARDNADYRGSKSTMPARQREGHDYQGGRALRRAMRRLKSNQASVAGTGTNKIGTPSYTAPGAMRP